MTDTPELLPCPFCGGANAFFPVMQKERVKCERCRAVTDSYAERHQAIAAWNRRTPAPVSGDMREVVARAIATAYNDALPKGVVHVSERDPIILKRADDALTPHIAAAFEAGRAAERAEVVAAIRAGKPFIQARDTEWDAELGRALYEEMCRLDPGDDPEWQDMTDHEREFYRLCVVRVLLLAAPPADGKG